MILQNLDKQPPAERPRFPLAAAPRFLRNFLRGELVLIRDRIRLAYIASHEINARIDPRAIIRVEKSCDLFLSPGVYVGAFSVITVQTDRKYPTPRETRLSIGRNTYIGEQNNIRAYGLTTIGENCLISQNVSIIAANHSLAAGTPIQEQPWNQDKVGVHIGNDVWIGANAVVLPGVTIGEGAVVAAGSVVSRNIEPFVIAAGAPARAIGNRNDS